MGDFCLFSVSNSTSAAVLTYFYALLYEMRVASVPLTYACDARQRHRPGVSETKGHFGQVNFSGRLGERGGGRQDEHIKHHSIDVDISTGECSEEAAGALH